MRGFAVVSTDTGHKSHGGPFDFGFMKGEQAYLDFAYLANAQVAALAKQLIAQYYGKPAAFSYFSGCSTGGREGMILSQRYPAAFDGIISGDPAMRTGLSNLAIAQHQAPAIQAAVLRIANTAHDVNYCTAPCAFRLVWFNVRCSVFVIAPSICCTAA